MNNDIAGLGSTLGTTTTTANSALALATTANATASTALGNGITNSAQISSINQTLPTLISSNSLSNILNTCNYLPKSGGTLTGTLNAVILQEGGTNLSAKYQSLLTASTNLLGVGSSITAIDYNKITLNKPSVFPADMTNIYNKTEVNTFINNSSNYTSNTSNTLKGFIDTNLINSSNYTLNTSNTLKGFIDTKQATLTTSTTLLGIGSNLTLINYANITGTPSLNYLPLAGGALTGNLSTNSQITGFTTLNGTTGIFGTLSTTNNTNQAIPSVGNFGGIGDKLVLYNGTSMTYPYSIGYETNALWISSPNTIKIYNNGINSIFINSSGNVGIGLSPSYRLHITAGNSTISTVYAMKVSGGVFQNTGGNYGTLIGLGTEDAVWSKCAIGHVRTAGYDVGDIVFLCRNTIDNVSADMNNEKMRILNNGNVGIGTNNPNAILELYSTTQLNTRLILSGQEFYQPYNSSLNNSQSTGIAFLCGVNRPGNKQLWIGDSALTAQNTTNGIIRIMPNGGYIDACSTNGTVLPLTLGNSGSQTTIYGSTINLSGMCSVNNNLNVGNGYYIDFSGGAGDGKIYRPDGNLRIEIDDIINFKSTFANNTIVFNQGAVSIPTTLSCGQFSTSSYNNLVMKTIFINPYSSIGGPYNNGYWLIDVYDYSSQYGFVYLFLNINAIGLLYWLGRVVIANSSSFNTYADMGYNVQLGLTTLNSRLQIIISCPSGTNNGLAQLCVKIMG